MFKKEWHKLILRTFDTNAELQLRLQGDLEPKDLNLDEYDFAMDSV